jgi:hypothetical protein
MNAPARNFRHRPAVREQTPLIIGITAPSGGGKTMSALRLATGIVAVRGGKVVGIDTEANRMLHYAPAPGEKPDPAKGTFAFEHIAFSPPFSSDAYLEVLTYAAEIAAGGCVIVDSMSHEHEGSGGYLEFHDAEVERLSGGDRAKAQRVQIGAWIKPAAARRRLINGFLQINCSFIFCFRAKEKIKPVAGKEPIQLGWQAIAGDEFVYEMTSRCLLPPGAKGVPSWDAEAFAHNAAKLQGQHREIFRDGEPLDERTGSELARWAAGSSAAPTPKISEAQVNLLKQRLGTSTITETYFLNHAKLSKLEDMDAADFDAALIAIDKRQVKK